MKVTVQARSQQGYRSIGKLFSGIEKSELEVTDEEYAALFADRAHLVIIGGPTPPAAGAPDKKPAPTVKADESFAAKKDSHQGDYEKKFDNDKGKNK